MHLVVPSSMSYMQHAPSKKQSESLDLSLQDEELKTPETAVQKSEET